MRQRQARKKESESDLGRQVGVVKEEKGRVKGRKSEIGE